MILRNRQPNSGTKPTCPTWVAQKKNEKICCKYFGPEGVGVIFLHFLCDSNRHGDNTEKKEANIMWNGDDTVFGEHANIIGFGLSDVYLLLISLVGLCFLGVSECCCALVHHSSPLFPKHERSLTEYIYFIRLRPPCGDLFCSLV